MLSPYPPYPPHGGGTMRIYQLVRGLAERHDLTCLSFAPDLAAEQALAPLQRICRVVTVRGPIVRSTARRAWTTLASLLPDMALRNAAPTYSAALRALLATEQFDIVQAESIEMAGYLLQVESSALSVQSKSRSPKFGHTTQNSKLVLDQFNAEYLLQKRAALTSLRAGFRLPSQVHDLKSNAIGVVGGVYSLAQWRKLERYERRVMRQCDAVVAVADEDRGTLLRLAPKATIGVVPNGVDTGYFSRAAMALNRVAALPFGSPTLVFSGTLDFRPNVDALTWFVREVLPRVRARQPEVRLLVVGKRPAAILRQLVEQGALLLTGEVPDVRPYLTGAGVYIIPMRIGGGVRLKLLEALALELPIVSTSMGAEGVAGLRADEHCLVADDAAGFAEHILRLLHDPALGARLGAAGRALVRERYDWSVIVPRLEALYQDLLGA
ncbi:MAG TPA: glycosyltransferase family 4 protein [Roseiflexaceae bacterium]|nr:glycosyltransferase family 4 protein [Roseiflexaceae bacterium]